MAEIPRICLTGPECTGKSLLAERLAAEFGTVWVPEFARDYVLRVSRQLTAADVEPIASGQMELEDRIAPRANRVLLLDTDLISTVVYARYYYGRCPAWIERAAAIRRAQHYLLLDIDVPFVLDPARDSAAARVELYTRFAAALEEFAVPHTVVAGDDWAARTQAARAEIARLLRR